MNTEAKPGGLVDINELKTLFIGAVTDPEQTWATFRQDERDVKSIFLGYTLPLVVGSVVVAAVLSFVFGTQGLVFTTGRSFTGMLQEMLVGSLTGCIGLALLAAIVMWVARLFGGEGRYEAALSMSTLVAVPAMLASIPGALPWIGWLIQLGAAIYSLVLLYRAIPVFLQLESSRRPLHYICSLVAMIVANLVLGAVFGGVLVSSDERAVRGALSERSSSGEGMFGNLIAMAELYEAAERDTYDAPRNGEVSRDQLRNFLRVAEDTAARQARYVQELAAAQQQLSAAEADGGIGAMFSAMRAVSTGMAAGGAAFNAEMAAVKESGGNWAEHMWVRERLMRARYEIADEQGQAANRALYQREKAGIDKTLDQLSMATLGQ
jgi:hypothetical protein